MPNQSPSYFGPLAYGMAGCQASDQKNLHLNLSDMGG
jgi:hypothetical protein